MLGLPPATADLPDDSTATTASLASPCPARLAGSAGRGVIGAGADADRPAAVRLSPQPARRRVVARVAGGLARPAPGPVVLVAADQPAVRTCPARPQWSTTAADAVARRLCAAVAAELEQPA